MTDRLTESHITRELDRGIRSLPSIRTEQNHFIEPNDLKKLLERDDSTDIIQALQPQQLLGAIKSGGIREFGAAIRSLSQDQFIRVLDYDAWHKDELVHTQAIQWLDAHATFGENSLAQRYHSLDEEYQITLLQGLIDLKDSEEIESLTVEQQDQYVALPGADTYYAIFSSDTDTIDFIRRLIESAMDFDVAYALSLLAHAAYSVPQEPQGMIEQFRKSRLEEDGFVSYEESLHAFRPIDFVKLKAKWFQQSSLADSDFLPISAHSQNRLFLDQILEKLTHDRINDLQPAFGRVANSLAAASGTDPSDYKAINEILCHTRTICSLGLEFLSDQNSDLATVILNKEHPKDFFRTGLSLIYLVQTQTLNMLEQKGYDVSKLRSNALGYKWGSVLYELDTKFLSKVGFELNEMLKGLFNRYPMRPEQKRDEPNKIKFRPFEDLLDLNEFTAQLKVVLNELPFLQ
jgi:hypothetical protein